MLQGSPGRGCSVCANSWASRDPGRRPRETAQVCSCLLSQRGFLTWVQEFYSPLVPSGKWNNFVPKNILLFYIFQSSGSQ